MTKISKRKGPRVAIIGAGGLGRETHWIFCDAIEKAGENWDIVGFIDEDPEKWGKTFSGISVLGDFGWFGKAEDAGIKVICAVGSPFIKRMLVEKAKNLGLGFCSVIHPSAQLSKYVEIGLGTAITAGCILTTQIKIGNHVYLNLDTTVGHDVVIHDYVNVSPGCHISGNVTLMEGADLGTGAVVLQGITIGKWSTVGAGAVVLDDVPDNTVVVGTPAEVIRYKE